MKRLISFFELIRIYRNAFDEDVKELVQVRVVHGFWKREDGRIQVLEVSSKTHV